MAAPIKVIKYSVVVTRFRVPCGKAVENKARKGENAGNQYITLFSWNYPIWAAFYLSFAKPFNLGQSKVLLCG